MSIVRWKEADRYIGRATSWPVDLSSFTTDDLQQGSSNTYLDMATVYAGFSASSPLFYNGAGRYSLDNPTTIVDIAISGELKHTGNTVGFYNITPITQPSDIGAETNITDSTGGTVDGTLAAISGSGADADINNNFADLANKVNSLVSKVNSLRTTLQSLGLMA